MVALTQSKQSQFDVSSWHCENKQDPARLRAVKFAIVLPIIGHHAN